MKYILSSLLIGLTLFGCSSKPVEESKKSTTIMDTHIENFEISNALDVGDVEQGIHIEAVVTEEDCPNGSKLDELRTSSKDRLTMATLDIEGSKPASLTVTLRIDADADFTANPVGIRATLYREVERGVKEELYSFNALADKQTNRRRDEDPTQGLFRSQFSAEVLTGLDGLPPTMLVYVEATAILLGVETDTATVDVAAAESNDNNSVLIISNPLRINFTETAAAVAPEVPATEEPVATETAIGAPAVEVVPETPATDVPVATAPAIGAPAAE